LKIKPVKLISFGALHNSRFPSLKICGLPLFHGIINLGLDSLLLLVCTLCMWWLCHVVLMWWFCITLC